MVHPPIAQPAAERLLSVRRHEACRDPVPRDDPGEGMRRDAPELRREEAEIEPRVVRDEHPVCEHRLLSDLLASRQA